MKYVIVNEIQHEIQEVSKVVMESNAYILKFKNTYAEVTSFLSDDTEWAIKWEDGQIEDCSSYCVVGSVLDSRDGIITITMREQTDLEEAYELLYGNEDELESEEVE